MVLQSNNYSNIFLNFKISEDAICDMGIPEHCLLYICSGEIEFQDNGKKVIMRAGDCAFIRRDLRIAMHKRSCSKTNVYQSILLRFTRKFLHDFYRKLDPASLPSDVKRSKTGILKINSTPEVMSLFDSIKPFFETTVEPTEQWLNMKMIEGLMVVLNANKNVYASLFDFTTPWKIDIIDFLDQNYMYDLNLEDMARYTGRSLTTFKRDFKKISELTPEKWIVNKRLQVAHDLIVHDGRKVKDVLVDVGFKNMSHFSRVYKKMYGTAPSLN